MLNRIRLTCSNGDTFETNINGTPDEVRAYYLGRPAGDLTRDYDEFEPPRFYTGVEFLPPPLPAPRLTAERANEIFEQAKRAAVYGPWSDQLDKVMTADERAQIMAKWRTMPGRSCFVSALFAIKNGEE